MCVELFEIYPNVWNVLDMAISDHFLLEAWTCCKVSITNVFDTSVEDG